MRNIKTILMVMLLLTLALSVTVGLTSCNETEVHVHEFKTEVLIEATCTEAGDAKYTCTCGYSYTETVPALGHTVVADDAVAATCTESGLTAGTHCSACNLVLEKQTIIAPLGHKLGAEATCTTAQVCENEGCGKVFVEALGHLVTSKATCTESADCALCGEVIHEALGHDFDVKKGYAETCLTDGLSDGKYCKRCTYSEVAEVIPATNHALTGVVTDPTCEDKGYTTYSCLCGLKDYVGDYVDALGHDYNTEIVEGAYGFCKACANGCGTSVAVAAPVANSYKATIQNGYASERANELIMKAAEKGAWGITLNVAKWSNEYDGGIGSFDEANRGVKYEFVLENSGYIDLLWAIAGANYDGSGNAGLEDMAAHLTVTIDGKPVDISGLALPHGGQWWNLQDFVIEGIALEAGVHTIEVNTIAHGGLNIGYLSLSSNQKVNARSVKVLSADLVEENGRVYYDLKAEIFGYTMDELQMLDGALEYKLHSYSVENGITTLRYDVTQEYKLYPHIKADGKWYVNGSNTAGDMTGVSFDEGQTIVSNGRTYTLATIYSMPVLQVAMNEGTAASATPVSADLVEENGKVYWTFTYKLVGYYPEYLLVFDGSTNYPAESVVLNADGTVTYKINVTDAAAKVHYPHLKVMEVTYTGAGHTDAGDIHAESIPTKSILIGKKEYKVYSKYDMPVIEIVDSQPTFVNTAYDLVEYEGKPCLKLTYRCIGYDATTAEFFDGSKVLPYTLVIDGANAIYYIDLTNTVGGDFWCHLRLNGQLWNGKEGTTSSNGDLLCPDWTGKHEQSWVTKKELTVNGQKYVLGVMWSMFIIGH